MSSLSEGALRSPLPASPSFDATIEPHCALNNSEYAFLVAAFVALALGGALFANASGVAPIGWFCGGYGLLTAGLLVSWRGALNRSERVTVGDGHVTITRQSRGRQVFKASLPLIALRLQREDDPDFGCQSVTLIANGRSVMIGRDLSPPERAALAKAFTAAIGGVVPPSRMRTIVALPLDPEVDGLEGEPTHV
jgi:uncharacterized membrane protein